MFPPLGNTRLAMETLNTQRRVTKLFCFAFERCIEVRSYFFHYFHWKSGILENLACCLTFRTKMKKWLWKKYLSNPSVYFLCQLLKSKHFKRLYQKNCKQYQFHEKCFYKGSWFCRKKKFLNQVVDAYPFVEL